MNEIFSEVFARRDNTLTRLDGRLKAIVTIAAILIMIVSPFIYLGLIISAFCVMGLLWCKVPVKIIIIRLLSPLGIAATILFIKTFLLGDSQSGILIVSKVLGSSSLILLLSITTPLDRLLAACRTFKVPAIWIEICLIAYRYIFVLFEDAATVFYAQKVRLGYSGLARSLRSIGELAGAIIIRAYDQSMATYEAMISRGYRVR